MSLATDHRFDTDYLEEQVMRAALQENINRKLWATFIGRLRKLKKHNLGMYQHSLRVGLYAWELAGAEGSDRKFALFGGCGHDLGKVAVSNQLLDAKSITPEQFETIKDHANAGFDMWRDRFAFTALVAGLHHKYRQDGYGITLADDAPFQLGVESSVKVVEMAKMIMLIDFYDSMTTRQNDKGLLEDISDSHAAKDVMMKHFPDKGHQIDWLFRAVL